jgi:hypothetical protein
MQQEFLTAVDAELKAIEKSQEDNNVISTAVTAHQFFLWEITNLRTALSKNMELSVVQKTISSAVEKFDMANSNHSIESRKGGKIMKECVRRLRTLMSGSNSMPDDQNRAA